MGYFGCADSDVDQHVIEAAQINGCLVHIGRKVIRFVQISLTITYKGVITSTDFS